MSTLQRWWEAFRSSFWFVPTVMAIGAVLLSYGMSRIDQAFGAKFALRFGWTYSGGPEGARGVLSAIAGSVIGVAGTTFSITIAVLSLTSGQFGPRLLRNFMRDLGNQIVLGTFTSTYLYCLLVLRTVRGTDHETYVPHFSVTLGVVLAVSSVGVLIYFVNHVAQSIQVSHIIGRVGEDADEATKKLFPSSAPACTATPPSEEPAAVFAGRIGYVESIDEDGLLALASEHGLVVRLEVRPGDYVLPAMKLLSVWPAVGDQEAALRDLFSCGRDRTTFQDVEFAFLELTEVAVRALSPGINDPFTAEMCVDRITASMCLVAARFWPSSIRLDDKETPRVFRRILTPSGLVQAAFGHIRHAAKDSPGVLLKLRASLDVLIGRAADPALRIALEHEGSKLSP